MRFRRDFHLNTSGKLYNLPLVLHQNSAVFPLNRAVQYLPRGIYMPSESKLRFLPLAISDIVISTGTRYAKGDQASLGRAFGFPFGFGPGFALTAAPSATGPGAPSLLNATTNPPFASAVMRTSCVLTSKFKAASGVTTFKAGGGVFFLLLFDAPMGCGAGGGAGACYFHAHCAEVPLHK